MPATLARIKPWLPVNFEFMSGFPEPERQRRLLFVIQACIDESGVKGTDPVCRSIRFPPLIREGGVKPSETQPQATLAKDPSSRAPPHCIDLDLRMGGVALRAAAQDWSSRREGRSAVPSFVRLYSTLGGTSG